MATATIDVVRLLEIVLNGVSAINTKVKEARQMDNRVIDLLVSFTESSYRLEKYRTKIDNLDEDDARMAMNLLRPVQTRIVQANELFLYYCGEDLDPNTTDDADFESKAPRFVKQTKWDRDREYLTTMAADVVKYTDNFIKFMDDRQKEVDALNDIPWDDDFKVGSLASFSRNMSFSGREDILDQISSLLIETTGRAEIILEGIGGIGKSQIALEYAFRSAKIYDSILWIDAHDSQSLRTGIRNLLEKIVTYYITKISTDNYAEIGKKFGMPWLVDANGKLKINDDSRGKLVFVKDWLFGYKQDKDVEDDIQKAIFNWLGNRKNKRWLMIIDNMDDPTFKTLDDVIPNCDWGNVIITSRIDSLPEHATDIHVDDPGIDTGVEILLKSSGKSKSNLSAREFQAVEGISRILNNHPLALDIVGTYVDQNLISFSKYQEKLDKDHGLLFRTDDNIPGKEDIIDLTYLVTYNSLSENARHILNLFSFFDNQNISKSVVQKHGVKFATWLKDSKSYSIGVHELLRYSMVYVRKESKDNSLAVHPVIHSWVRSRLDQSQTQYYARMAVMILSEVVSGDDPTTERRYWLSIYPHITAILKVIQNVFLTTSDQELLDGIEKIAACLVQLCFFQKAAGLIEYLLSRYRELYDSDNIETVEAEETLASSYYFLGRYVEAIDLYKLALKSREKTFGVNDPATLADQRNLGSLYKNIGDYQKSLKFLQDVVARSTTSLGDTHLETVKARKTLGLLYKDMERYKDALKLLTESYESYKSLFGDNNPDTIDTLLSLGELYRILGQYEESFKSLKKAHSQFEAIYGEEHPATLKASECLGVLDWRRGDYKLARDRLEKSLGFQKKIFGDEHPKVLKIIGYIGSIYLSLGDYKKSLELSLQATKGFENSLGKDHRDTLRCVLTSGMAYFNLEEFDDAMNMFQRSLIGFERYPISQDLALTTLNIGRIHLVKYQYVKAKEMLTESYDQFNKLFGKAHPNTLEVLTTLGSLYNEMGHTQKALEIFKEVLDIYDKSENPRLPNVSTTLDMMGQAYTKNGEYNFALVRFKQALANRKKYLGDEHPATLRTIKDIGFTYLSQGEFQTAKTWFELSLKGFNDLGYENSTKFDALNGIGMVYTEMGKPSEALSYFQESIKGYEELYGSNHPKTIEVFVNIGFSFEKIKKLDKALEYYNTALNKCNNNKTNFDNTLLLTINSHIGSVYIQQQKYFDSKNLLEGLVRDYENDLGEDHIDTFKTKEKLGVVYGNLKQYKEAFEILDEALKRYDDLLGLNNTDSKRVKNLVKTFKRERRVEKFKNILFCRGN